MKVKLNGFKGITRTYHLQGPTFLQGPNGTGKSACLEAIVYVVSGIVPEGKNLDAVSHYFGARGGDVTLTDDAGHWIKRGITVDHEKHKVSEMLTTSDTEEDAKQPDMSAWECNPIVLDVRELLSLSAAKSREATLKLCGQGEADSADILKEIVVQYAKEIAGPAATAETLSATGDLPAEIRELAHQWFEMQGLIQSYLSDADKTATQQFLALGEVAKQQRLTARRAAMEAKQAIKELEAAAQGAAAAEEEVKTRRHEVAVIRGKLVDAREQAIRAEESLRALGHARELKTSCEKRCADCEDTIQGAVEPGARPTLPAMKARLNDIQGDIDAIEADKRKIQKDLDAYAQLSKERDERTKKIGELRHDRTEMESESLGQAVQLSQQIPNSVHPVWPQLKTLIFGLGESWSSRYERLGETIDNEHRRIATINDELKRSEDHIETLELALKRQDEAIAKLKKESAKLLTDHHEAEKKYERDLADWRERDNATRKAKSDLEHAKEALHRACAEFEIAKKRHENIELPDMDEIEAQLYHAEAVLKTAEESAGTVRAYHEATKRAKDNLLAEKAWKHAEKAISVARERFVGSATEGLIADVNSIFAAAGREERAYLRLENDRGKPDFELGWSRNGARTALPALSGGETVLFCAALSYAIAIRAEGRRFLLVEADPVDEKNLEVLLDTLKLCAPKLEILVVATAQDILPGEGWHVDRLA